MGAKRTWIVVATLAAAALPSFSVAQMTPAFGPNQYTRTGGRPQVFTETFEHCGTAACQIVVINGNADGTRRVSSASILLNGVQIVGPRDFNRTVPTIVRPVALAEQNQLTIRLASSPGSFLAVSVECEASPVLLSAGGPGVSLLQTSTLLSAQPIRNSGTAPAENVQLSAINLNEGTLTIPTSIPFGLGTIPVDDSVVLDTNFVGTFFPLQGYDLSLEGTYDVGAATYCFTLDSELVVPPGAPGSRFIDSATVEQNQVSDAPFPHQPREPRSLDFVNGPLWSVPLGPFTPGTPTPTETQLQVAPPFAPARQANADIALLDGPGPIVFRANNGLGLTSGGTNGTTSSIAEPSGASNAEGVIFATANWVASSERVNNIETPASCI